MPKAPIYLSLVALAACGLSCSSGGSGHGGGTTSSSSSGGASSSSSTSTSSSTSSASSSTSTSASSSSTSTSTSAAGGAMLSISPTSATVSPGGAQVFEAHGGRAPWTWSLPTAASGGTVSALADQVPIAAAPALSGAQQWQHWAHGAPVVVRDNHGDHDLFTLGSPGALSGKLHLLRSADRGSSWSFPSPDAYAQPVDSYINAGLVSVAQDSTGTVHLLYARVGYGDIAYYRLELTYAGGAITGYDGLVGPLVIPGTYAGDLRGELRVVKTANDAEVLAVLIGASGNGPALQGSVCITANLAPTSASDFKSLTGAPNAVTQIINDTRGPGGSHDHTLLFAQLGATRDLWVFAGNVTAEPGPTTPSTLNRVRLTASGSTWSAGPLVDGATKNVWLMGVEGTTNHVWAMYGRYDDGQVLFARVDGSGGFEEPVGSIPSPVNDGRIQQTMFGVFTVNPDETHLWTVFTRDPSPTGNWYDFTPTAGSWDGAAWQLHAGAPAGDTHAISYAEGLGGTVGWDDGVVGLMTKTAGTSFNGHIQLVTSRGPSALYTAGPAAPSTDVVQVQDGLGASASATVTVP